MRAEVWGWGMEEERVQQEVGARGRNGVNIININYVHA